MDENISLQGTGEIWREGGREGGREEGGREGGREEGGREGGRDHIFSCFKV